MRSKPLFLALAAVLPLPPSSLAAPAPRSVPNPTLFPRVYSQCGQYQQTSQSIYTLYTNGWGWSSGSGGQCSQIDSLSGSSIAWSTTWSWANTPNQVKSYTNIEAGMSSKPLSQYQSIPTSWSWSYTGTDLRCNVAYDTFLGTSPTGAQGYEVMVWLGVFGGVSPLSDNGYPSTPIATPTIAGVAWDLIYGHNGNTKVYSFVAHSHAATAFSGDLLEFYRYLEASYAVSSGLYLQTIQAGSEVFTGSGAKLTTMSYSISVN